MATRLLQSLVLLTVRPTISGLYPPLLYYTQLYGALLKTWVLFRLDRQRWTRQNIAWAPAQPGAAAPAGRRLARPAPAGPGALVDGSRLRPPACWRRPTPATLGRSALGIRR